LRFGTQETNSCDDNDGQQPQDPRLFEHHRKRQNSQESTLFRLILVWLDHDDFFDGTSKPKVALVK
jgi:hypothetical protein